MGIFDFLKNKNTEKKDGNPSAQEEKNGYYGDLEKTAHLTKLFKVPQETRDDIWKSKFLANVAEAGFACGNPQIIQGPDGFPYFQLETPRPNKAFQTYVIRHIIPDFILEQGIGVVINAHKGQPDWVFTYGDLVNFFIRNEFYTPTVNLNLPKQETLQQDEQVLIGQPSEEYLPQKVRHILRQFIEQQGIRDVKIALMSRKYGDEVLQELITNLTPEKIGEQLYEGLQTHLKWFLPDHYSVVAIDDDGSLKDDFELL